MTHFKSQKYYSLKKKAIKNGELFVDPQFPPSNKSIFFSKVDKEIEWKRPKELCKVPKLVVEGATCDELTEGVLGNAWFVSACSSLASIPHLFAKVIPNMKEQDWGCDIPYAGIFRFSFWRFGQWIEVVIDDQLPTKNNMLVFCHSKNRNEFWSSLLEKAYAKLFGDYETLSNGHAADALVDFTGGLAERINHHDLDLDVDNNMNNYFFSLLEAHENGALIICSIQCPRENVGDELEEGLLKGQGYSISAVRNIRINKSIKSILGLDCLQLFRMNNPCATKEWGGKWSDDSREMQTLSLHDRDEMGINYMNEGEFWMSYQDFVKYFDWVDICHLMNTSLFTRKKTWNESSFRGEWTVGARGTKRDRAGGCDELPDKFLCNPQYLIDISSLTGESFMVCLDQYNFGEQSKEHQFNEVGFHIMRVDENRRFRVHIAGEKAWVSKYEAIRSVFERVTLTKGRYVIIPSTRNPGIACKFLLRMYSSNATSSRELILEFPKNLPCCSGYQVATKISLKGGKGLTSIKYPTMPPSPMVIVTCERESYKTGFCQETSTPTWTCNLVFYRKDISKPITIIVYNHKTMLDEFLGMCKVEELSHDNMSKITLKLYGKGNESEVQRSGEIYIELETSADLTSF